MKILALLLAFVSLPLVAHEGTLQKIAITIEEGTFEAVVPIEPLTLLNRIELANGEALTENERDAARLLSGRTADIARSITIDFQVEGASIPTRPHVTLGASSLRLTGAVPKGADGVLFRNALASGDAVLLVRDGTVATETPLHGDDSGRVPLAVRRSAVATFADYLRLGIVHIIPLGLDHILFVLGLFFLSPRIRTLLAQISTFTLAHTLTLGLSIFGIVSIDAKLVEPLIALSIVFVAVENLRKTEGSRGRIAVVAAFGLLHGLGFASALREVGLPARERALALVAFNAGVEVAQLAVVACAFVCVLIARRWTTEPHRRLAVPASLLIAATGVWWTIERVL